MSESERTSNDNEPFLGLRALPGRAERLRILMGIAGYPHYENACSNILAFFMDPEDEGCMLDCPAPEESIRNRVGAGGGSHKA